MDLRALQDVVVRDGVLLLSDAALPSLTSLVVGGPIGGSWWGHPRGGEIYHLSNQLADLPDILVLKLVAGKVTFVHRRLWPAIVAVGGARESWQVQGLSEAALTLLRLVDDAGQLAWDDVPPVLPPDFQPPAASVKVLERALLIHTSEVHTPRGAHARNLATWSAWAATVGGLPPLPAVAVARQQLETALDHLNTRHAARARLPWQLPARAHLRA